MKTCNGCHRRKRLSSFASRGSGRAAARCRSCDREKSRTYYREQKRKHGPAFVRSKNEKGFEARRRRLGYDEMFEKQNGLCAICGKPETRTRQGKVCRLSIDHDHQTGMVRRLLCGSCNYGLGCFKDDPDLLEAAATYLRSFQKAEV